MNGHTDRQLTGQIDELLVRQLRLQATAMSLIVLFLLVCALAALSRLPEFSTVRAPGWQMKMAGTVLFSLLFVVGLVDNVCTHRTISRITRKDELEVD